jgi:glutamate/tyrosine decarboxylase-like PLP-dependent enzyme
VGTLRELLEQTAGHAADFLEAVPDRPVGPPVDADDLRASLGGPLPAEPATPSSVIEALAAAADPGLVAIPGGRYFGFVIGGAVPAALAADWLTSAWDQNAGLYVAGPAAGVVEEVAGAWLAELLGLPAGVSFGFVTGCQMAHVTALAAARHAVLDRAGWDVNEQGLVGAPAVHVVASEERHTTIDRALRFLGLGNACVLPVAADDQGRMHPDALRAVLAGVDGPTIVCAQAGNVNTGSFDPLEPIADAAEEAGAWLHVDGAFGLWAAASPSLRHLVAGVERADSWATDAHKWLNVPYDSGIAFCAHPDAHRAAMGARASYLIHAEPDGPRDELDWNPEFSRRARGFPIYAAIRSLGRSGIAELVDRCCAHARRFGEALAEAPGVEVLNEVVLNQVLVRFLDPAGDHDSRTAAVIHAVQEDGTCWLGGTTWHGMGAMRISVSNWSTTEEDVERSIEAILRASSSLRPQVSVAH